MSAPLGIGKAFGDFIGGERQNRDLYGAAEAAAQRFESIGSDNAKQMAQMMRSDPRGTFAMASQFGGMKELFALEEANVARQRVTEATAGLKAGSPEYSAALAPVAAEAGEFGAAANLLNISRPDAPVSPFGKVDPSDFTSESLAKFSKTNNLKDLVRQYAPNRNEEITVGPDGTVIRRGSFAQVSKEATAKADSDVLFDAIDDLQELTEVSGGTVGVPAIAGRLAGGAGHLAEQYVDAPDGTAEMLTQVGSGGATQEEIAESDSLVQTVTMGTRSWLADKGNLNRDERKDLRNATGANALTPTNRIRSLKTIRAIGLSREIRRRRGIGQPHPLDPQTNPAGFIKAMQERGYSNEEIEKLDDRLKQ